MELKRNVASAYGPSLSYLIDEELNILQRKTHKLPNIASNSVCTEERQTKISSRVCSNIVTNMVKCMYLRMTLTDQNCSYEDIKSRL
jgi:hypothetical protein